MRFSLLSVSRLGQLSRLSCLAMIASLAACGASEDVVAIAPLISVQSKAIGFVQVFRVAALRQTTTDGQNISCDDFPATFQLGDARLQKCSPDPSVAATCEAQVPWELGKEIEARVDLQVPFNERLLFVVEGVASNPLAGGTHVVVRGCQGNLIFATGATHQTIAISAQATLGAACPTGAGCELGLQCHQDPTNFPGGYCTQRPCSSDAQCPPGGVCINDPSGGICARPCNATQDCAGAGINNELYNCEGRLAPTGCQRVCVWPAYNPSGKCG
ncbi:MAG: hypothetical protein JRH20_15935 [Deltaproteobacteria bacterium]|nr:hypothetical protein [Deltaproteobacteria bacterium]